METPPIIIADPDYNRSRSRQKMVKALAGLIPVLILTLGLIAGRQLVQQSQDVRQQASENYLTSSGVPANFNAVHTHPQFFVRDGQQYVGKRFFGTKSNAEHVNKKFMKSWSGPLDCANSSRRQLMYHYYDGWDDKPGKILEWETWGKDTYPNLIGFRWGGPVANPNPPYWPCSWMNYEPTEVKVSPNRYSCNGLLPTPSPGMTWPNLTAGQSIQVSKETASNPPTCNPTGNLNHFEYVAVAYREDFGTPHSNTRAQKCNQNFHPVWGNNSNPYNMCLDAPYVGRFDQRYAYYEGRWQYGCEPVVYAWGYPESGATHKYFRNGELRWADWKIFRDIGIDQPNYRTYNDHQFWNQGCDVLWQGHGGWMYSGVYQIGSQFFEDPGTASGIPVAKSATTPDPTPIPVKTTGSWTESTCGYSGEQWCQANTTCDTNWVGGPTKNVTCATNQKLRNTGDYYTRWDGLKRFIGTTSCIADTTCNPPTPTPTRIPTPIPPTPTPTPAPPSPTPIPPTPTRSPTPSRTPTPSPTHSPFDSDQDGDHDFIDFITLINHQDLSNIFQFTHFLSLFGR